jgi:phosphate transport system substrate-binding protein
MKPQIDVKGGGPRKKKNRRRKKMNKIKQIGKRLVKNSQAVSPVIATLMLVLVSVGAAGAFYAWQTNWQTDSTENVGDMDGKTNIVIGGSSTVYPFTGEASAMFEKEFPYAKLSYTTGGSGSGIKAAGEGIIDIGSASKWLPAADAVKYPDLVEHTVAYDMIAMIVPTTNTITGINVTEIQAIYYINGGATVIPDDVTKWMADYVAFDDGSIVYYDSTADPGEQIVWSHNNESVVAYERADDSGTEAAFCENLLGPGDGQLSEYGISVNKIDSNQNLLTALAAEPNGISFMSFGMAEGVNILNVDFELEGNYVEPSVDTIKDETYDAGRPINYLTLGEPTGLVKEYLDFVLIPRNNLDIAHAVGYISLYD